MKTAFQNSVPADVRTQHLPSASKERYHCDSLLGSAQLAILLQHQHSLCVQDCTASQLTLTCLFRTWFRKKTVSVSVPSQPYVTLLGPHFLFICVIRDLPGLVTPSKLVRTRLAFRGNFCRLHLSSWPKGTPDKAGEKQSRASVGLYGTTPRDSCLGSH